MELTSPATVLIVEDEPVGIASLAGILGDTYELIISKSLAEARRLLSDEIDIILLDLYLPDGSGLMFLKELKSSGAYTNVPIICISSSDQARDIENAFRHGATDYVLKPFNKIILSAKVATFIDLKHKTDMLAAAALIDPLTGIGNRRLFHQQLDLFWRRAKRQKLPVGLILIDLDNFKQINDQYGHNQGDICLQKLSSTMRSSFSRADEVVVRLGGDEFAILIYGADLNTTISAAKRLAEVLRKNLEPSPDLARHCPEFTVSMGCASTQPSTSSETAEFVETADRHLYEAKEHGGRNCVRPLF